MHLQELISSCQHRANSSVPTWMIGGFKRRSITFANGLMDTQTIVFWLQSRNLTIDLRLPIQSEQVTAQALTHAPEKALLAMADYEGWSANSVWQNDQLSWNGGTSFQVHNRWPEPAELKRIGDCMIEFAPSGAYVEDWRILSKTPGPLVGLTLIEETNLATGETQHRDGALIINGEWAGLVLGRPTPVTVDPSEKNMQLRERVGNNLHDNAHLTHLFQFETAIATGDIHRGFKVVHALHPQSLGQNLFELDGFKIGDQPGEVIHTFNSNGSTIKRKYRIDSIEAHFSFSAETPMTPSAQRWLKHEENTLGRYLTGGK